MVAGLTLLTDARSFLSRLGAWGLGLGGWEVRRAGHADGLPPQFLWNRFAGSAVEAIRAPSARLVGTVEVALRAVGLWGQRCFCRRSRAAHCDGVEVMDEWMRMIGQDHQAEHVAGA